MSEVTGARALGSPNTGGINPPQGGSSVFNLNAVNAELSQIQVRNSSTPPSVPSSGLVYINVPTEGGKVTGGVNPLGLAGLASGLVSGASNKQEPKGPPSPKPPGAGMNTVPVPYLPGPGPTAPILYFPF
jgi:hypothetical protein